MLNVFRQCTFCYIPPPLVCEKASYMKKSIFLFTLLESAFFFVSWILLFTSLLFLFWSSYQGWKFSAIWQTSTFFSFKFPQKKNLLKKNYLNFFLILICFECVIFFFMQETVKLPASFQKLAGRVLGGPGTQPKIFLFFFGVANSHSCFILLKKLSKSGMWKLFKAITICMTRCRWSLVYDCHQHRENSWRKWATRSMYK